SRRFSAYLQFVFFFQAEDGIRDRNVTGVQTCALPIYSAPPIESGLSDSLVFSSSSPYGVTNAWLIAICLASLSQLFFIFVVIFCIASSCEVISSSLNK